jgi:uncharacterized protein YyaL (SSP411 family)
LQTQPEQDRKPNRLIREKSPYLLQHAYNPVDWYPWSDEAFAKAKAEDKPVFVSIGYSTCHWCHVMEKECFDDVEVAKLMNEAFVSIKVDREERPDLDGSYMAVCQAMGRSCGWPLNVIMTPDKKPFFIASYIPKQSRFGLAGMADLVPQIREVWLTRRSELEAVADDVRLRIADMEKRTSDEEVGKEVLDEAYEKLMLIFDEAHGGFGDAPKFPTPHNLLFLMRYWKRTGEKNALRMVEKSLRSMRAGGIFDQIGLGLHRYSTDAEWLVPHFEKMLYDQALLALAYIEAFQATGAEEFAVTAREVLGYVLRDMSSSEGGFFSAEDADTEGEEGKFYLWTEQEIRSALLPGDADLAVTLFAIEARGNYYDPAERGRNGKNILHFPKPLSQLAAELNTTVSDLTPRVDKIREVLYEIRQRRVHPAKDNKVLTDWNGLMIAALAKAGQAMGDERYQQAAVEAADFFLKTMREGNVLFHRFVKGERAVEGFLDDYAFLSWGLIEVYEAGFDEKYLKAAFELTNVMVQRFWDDANGGFFFASKTAADVLAKRKGVYDGALPSGNSVALLNLLRLARLSNNPAYEEKAVNMNRAFAVDVKGSPAANTFFLLGVDFVAGPAYSVVIVGEPIEVDTLDLLRRLRAEYMPNTVVSLKRPATAGLGYERIGGKATAYVCHDQMCLPPTNNVLKMLELLGLGQGSSANKAY